MSTSRASDPGGTAGPFTPASAPTTPQIITDLVRGLIHRGEYAPGDRLPSERVLAEQLAVARVSLREALAQLQREGYLIARRGAQGGRFVTELVEPHRRWLQRMSQNLAALEDIIDFRIAVEVQAARLAATRKRRASIEAMEKAVRALSSATTVASFRAADTAFHRALARASQSPRLAAAIMETRGLLFMPVDAMLYPVDMQRSFTDHGKIAQAVRDGDQELVATAMREHIEATWAELRQLVTRACNVRPVRERPGPGEA